eukprot:TRINITY_DN18354_c0_g1_i1.p1 TRINITY_DN18354_c0_g1~~TRINITY_DN18354_c0_g1_i1.p1  ORF type:complete len:142 (+),score=28.36 TRINITY_DN18354_c0_g1_i1:77-502(+)
MENAFCWLGGIAVGFLLRGELKKRVPFLKPKLKSGSIRHVVLIKFKPDIADDTKNALIEGYMNLPKHIPAMKGFEWGTDVSVENMHEGFTHIFVTTFDNLVGRDIYLRHNAHDIYARWLFQNVEKILVLDFGPRVIKSPIT